MSASAVQLPSYLEMAPAVRDRFRRIGEREVVLEVRGLGKRFRTPQGEAFEALRDINFEVRRRELIAVIGPSGCGKSTLNRIIAGLDHPSSGEMLLDGQPVRGPGPDRGMVFQSYTLFPWLSVKKNVMFGLKMKGHSDAEAESEALQWIEMVGLKEFAELYPKQLSGGMKQRVAIARALANRPRILLMDEPFGALDAQTRCTMQRHLLQIWRNVDITILFITHDLDEAILLADRIIVLGRNPGHIQEIIEVPVPRPRSNEQSLDPPYLATRHRLDELIHPPSEDDGPELDLLRMTDVSDDVL